MRLRIFYYPSSSKAFKFRSKALRQFAPSTTPSEHPHFQVYKKQYHFDYWNNFFPEAIEQVLFWVR